MADERNRERIQALAGILIAKANQEKGLTADEIIKLTSWPKPTVYRLLKEPGFCKSILPQFPTGYYYDATKVQHRENGKKPVERQFKENVLKKSNAELVQVLAKINANLAEPLKAFMTQMIKIDENIEAFKKGESKLDIDLQEKLNKQRDDLLIVLETYYQYVHRFGSIDTKNPTWWENYQ